jgi:glutaredoxin
VTAAPGGGAADPQRRVVLYGAAGCHLCESARRVLEQVRHDVTFELVEIEITGVPELEARYRERIPVVSVDGEEAFTYFVHPDALRRVLRTRPVQGATS